MSTKRVCVVMAVMFALTGVVFAGNNVWLPSENDYPTGAEWSGSDSYWHMQRVPTDSDKAVFMNSGQAECIVASDVSVGQLSMGDGGPGGVVRVVDGASLTTVSDWSAVGMSGPDGNLIVEDGGSASFGGHLWVGHTPDATNNTVTINGGTVDVGGMFGIGWDGGSGKVEVNSGLLHLSQWSQDHPSIADGSVLDIEEGTVRIDYWQLDDPETRDLDFGTMEWMVDQGRITAYDGAGTVNIDWDAENNQTVLTAVPEPATMSILALGGLFLRRRRS